MGDHTVREKTFLKWRRVQEDVMESWDVFAQEWYKSHSTSCTPGYMQKVWGVPRGGVHVAQLLADLFGKELVDTPEEAHVIVDDITDSGKTAEKYAKLFPGKPFFSLYKSDGTKWLVFPWEKKDEGVDDNIARILEYYGWEVTKANIEGLRVALENHLSDDTTK
jgi:hypothetical protein